MSFNLSKMLKSAMGADAMKYRPRGDWFEYNSVVSGRNEKWNEITSEYPSVSNVLSDVAVERNKKVYEAMDTWGLTASQAEDMMKTFVGFTPGYGMYSCYVGPYLSKGERHGEEHVHKAGIDRFGYFRKRHNQFTPQEMALALERVIKRFNTLFAGAGVVYDASDFRLVSATPSGDLGARVKQKNRSKNVEVDSMHWDISDPENLNSEENRQNNPELAALLDKKLYLGLGSKIMPNSKGYTKLFKNSLGKWGTEALNEEMAKTGKTIDEIFQEAIQDKSSKYIEKIYKSAYKKWTAAKEAGDDDVKKMPEPPGFKGGKVSYPATGQQTPTQLPENKEMITVFQMQKEIISYLTAGITDPAIIAEGMNNVPGRLKLYKSLRNSGIEPTMIDASDVSPLIEKINNKKQDISAGTNGTYQDVDVYIDKQIVEMQNTRDAAFDESKIRGYSDLRTAIEMAESFLSGNPVDPVTGSKLGNTTHVFTEATKNSENYDSEFLKSRRSLIGPEDSEEDLEDFDIEDDASVVGGSESVQAIENSEQVDAKDDTAKPEEIDFGQYVPDAVKPPEIIDFESYLQPNQPATIQPQFEQEKTEDVVGRDEKEKKKQEKNNLMNNDIFSSTVRSLISIARDLDRSGKENDAEEIHRVIRKYFKKG